MTTTTNPNNWTVVEAGTSVASGVTRMTGPVTEIVTSLLGYRVETIASPDQAWFWSEQWQAREAEADADIDAGRVARFESVDALFEDLDDDE